MEGLVFAVLTAVIAAVGIVSLKWGVDSRDGSTRSAPPAVSRRDPLSGHSSSSSRVIARDDPPLSSARGAQAAG